MNRLLREAVVAQLAPAGRVLFSFGFWNSFDESDWSRALDWLDESGLALYFLHNVKAVKMFAGLPSYVRTRLARSLEENCLRVDSIRKESAILNSLFDDAGVQYAILKGLALVPDYCPDPTLRTQYDHDYLIRLDALARAEAALLEAGYQPRVSREGHHIGYYRSVPEVIYHTKTIGLYSAMLQRPVELHVRLWENTEDRIDIALPDDFMHRLRNRSVLGLEYPALCDEDGLIFQVLHAFRHILRNWCRLAVFFEISYFLQQRALDSDFWARYQERAANLRWVPEASSVVFGLTRKLFGASIPAKLKTQINPKFSATVDRWIELYGLPGALANFRNNKNSLFLHRQFVEDQSIWAEVRRRRLIPFRWPHRVPGVLIHRGTSNLARRLTQYLHCIRRLKFHAVSAIRYAWECPRWQILRKMRTPDELEQGSARVGTGSRNSELSLEPVVTQFRKISVFRD